DLEWLSRGWLSREWRQGWRPQRRLPDTSRRPSSKQVGSNRGSASTGSTSEARAWRWWVPRHEPRNQLHTTVTAIDDDTTLAVASAFRLVRALRKRLCPRALALSQ